MSSHKEAPGISNDPAADNSDVYAFVSPDKPNTVTLIANFVPLEDPAGGPNFYEFGDDVLYEIHVQNSTTTITYGFTFTTTYTNPNTFLYNTGPITSLASPAWNRKQFATITKTVGAAAAVTIGTNLACPPCNVGPASTPNYAALAQAALHTLNTGEIVFTGQRAEGFYVDIGAIFDLGQLRPLSDFYGLNKMPSSKQGINTLKAKNIHSLAIQVPITDLAPLAGAATARESVIGVYASAKRSASRTYSGTGAYVDNGPRSVQVSRLGNPLVNEVIIPLGQKDRFNAQPPSADAQFVERFRNPELAQLLPVLYPTAFPKLAALNKQVAAKTKNRADIIAILLTGLPTGVVPNFQNYTGPTQQDMLRLNVAVPPKTTGASNLGLIGGDPAGFPNGRRVFDDVTTIELRALGGAVYGLVDTTFTADAAVGQITEGLTSSNTDMKASNTEIYQTVFPYLGTPHSGYLNPASNAPAPDLGPINQAPQVVVPVGPPDTGGGASSGLQDRGVLTAAGVALAGAAVAGGLALKSRPTPATVASSRDQMDRTAQDRTAQDRTAQDRTAHDTVAPRPADEDGTPDSL